MRTRVVLITHHAERRKSTNTGRLVARALEGAEPVMLPPGAPSRYGLRRAPREGTVSTLEAVARALAVLEADGAEIERGLMAILDAFVERSQRAAGRGR